MPPKKTSKTGRQRASTPQKLVPPQRNTRSKTVRSPSLSAVNSFPESTAAPQNLTERPRKRRYVSEDKPLNEEQQIQCLSEANLKIHNRLTELPLDTINSEVGSRIGGRGGRERGRGRGRGRGRQKTTSSRPQTSGYINQETTSVTSSTAAYYRYTILRNTSIFIRPTPLPKEVRSQINAIIQRKISAERKSQLSSVVENLCKQFVSVLDREAKEDDCIEPIHTALDAMNSSGIFQFARKNDWNPILKPSIPEEFQEPWDTNFMENPNDKSNDSVTQPRKQQEAGPSYLSLDTAMLPPPPPAVPTQEIFHIKNPRPDITVGLDHLTVVKALVARGLGKRKASCFLTQLQQRQILCSDPAHRSPTAPFPFMVVEGKAYATGRPIFEAQNQVAVSGSCMTKLQHELADLAKRAAHGSYDSKAPLAFSICTEGPHIELWVHYTTLEDNVRMYNMRILKTCHASLQEGVKEFLMVVDRILSWASEDFVSNTAEQLVLLQSALQGQQAV